ncbi:MAG TPA: nucleotide exchange factor GrpE [Tissierellaceae bacterium]
MNKNESNNEELKDELNENQDEEEIEQEEIENQDEIVDEEESENNEDLKSQLEESNNRFLRLQADFSNFKRRNEKERTGLVSLGKEAIVTDILPVIDNFERAMMLEDGSEKDSFYEGIELIQKQLIEVLEKHGVKEINCLHEQFDPNYHYAVQMQESDKYQPDVVINVMQKGYLLNDKVIRPAMVIVSK